MIVECFECGRRMGEKEPFKDKTVVIDICQNCKDAIALAKRVERTKTFMMYGLITS